MKLAWMTDLHLDQAEKTERRMFFEEFRSAEYDAAVITGDISRSDFLERDLLALGQACAPRPVFFVLGNHDLGSRGHEIDALVGLVCRSQQNLRPIWRQELVPLTGNSVLIGHHGNADADEQSDAASAHFRRVLPQALSRFRHVWLLTHVPPFVQAVRFSGRLVRGGQRDCFVGRSSGRVIASIARQFTGRRVSVLAGHTHCRIKVTISPTVDISVGGARRGYPAIQEIINVP